MVFFLHVLIWKYLKGCLKLASIYCWLKFDNVILFKDINIKIWRRKNWSKFLFPDLYFEYFKIEENAYLK